MVARDFWFPGFLVRNSATCMCLCGKRTSLRSRAPCSTLAVTVAGLEDRVQDSNDTGNSTAVAAGAIVYIRLRRGYL